jgi:ABC-type glycerol-3-phosphate transport system permease component
MITPVATVNFTLRAGREWGKIAATGVLVMLSVRAFKFVVRNYLVSCLMAGCVTK